jgi:hypothetical protein
MDDTLVGTHDLIAASFQHAVTKYSGLKLEENDVEMISGYSLPHMLSQKVPPFTWTKHSKDVTNTSEIALPRLHSSTHHWRKHWHNFVR